MTPNFVLYRTPQKVRCVPITSRHLLSFSQRSQNFLGHIQNLPFFRGLVRCRLTGLGGKGHLLNAFKYRSCLYDLFSRQRSVELLGGVEQVPKGN